MSACQKTGSYAEIYPTTDGVTFTSATSNTEPTISGGGTPYQCLNRQNAWNYVQHSTGNCITGSDGAMYQLVNFAVCLTDLSEILEE